MNQEGEQIVLKYRAGDDRSGLIFMIPHLAGGAAALGFGALILWLISSPGPAGLGGAQLMGGLLALCFFLVGAACLRRGGRGLRRALRWREGRGRHALEPWVVDFPRQEAFVRHSALATAGQLTGAAAPIALLLAPFHWAVFFQAERISWLLGAALLLLDLLPLALLAAATAWALHHHRHGGTLVRFGRFPLRAGRQLQLSLSAARAPLGFESLTATLRCVQWRAVKRGAKTAVQAVELFSQRLQLTGGAAAPPRGKPIRLTFRPPPGTPGTRLDERPHRYWELVVEGRRGGTETHLEFMLPIYDKPE